MKWSHFGLFAIQVKLMLAYGRLPDTFGQSLSLAEPHIDMNISRIVRPPRKTHLSCGLTDGLGEVLVVSVDVLVQVKATERLHHPFGIVDFDRKLFVSKIQVLQLFPLENPYRSLSIICLVLCDS